jgi:hypothetical protein
MTVFLCAVIIISRVPLLEQASSEHSCPCRVHFQFNRCHQQRSSVCTMTDGQIGAWLSRSRIAYVLVPCGSRCALSLPICIERFNAGAAVARPVSVYFADRFLSLPFATACLVRALLVCPTPPLNRYRHDSSTTLPFSLQTHPPSLSPVQADSGQRDFVYIRSMPEFYLMEESSDSGFS